MNAVDKGIEMLDIPMVELPKEATAYRKHLSGQAYESYR